MDIYLNTWYIGAHCNFKIININLEKNSIWYIRNDDNRKMDYPYDRLLTEFKINKFKINHKLNSKEKVLNYIND